jgi:antitoxin VapB
VNIEDEETIILAQELARLTGETVTTVVREALRERIDRVRAATGTGLAERLLKIGKECAPLFKIPTAPSTTENCFTMKKGCRSNSTYSTVTDFAKFLG